MHRALKESHHTADRAVVGQGRVRISLASVDIRRAADKIYVASIGYPWKPLSYVTFRRTRSNACDRRTSTQIDRIERFWWCSGLAEKAAH